MWSVIALLQSVSEASIRKVLAEQANNDLRSSNSPPTDSAVVSNIHSRMLGNGTMQVHEPSLYVGKEAVIPVNELETLIKSKLVETDLVVWITSYLWPVLVDDGKDMRCICNSENNEWMCVSNWSDNDLKCDLILMPFYLLHHPHVISPISEQKSKLRADRVKNDKSSLRLAYFDGRPPTRTTHNYSKWYDCYGVFKAKEHNKIDDAAHVQLFRYINTISSKHPGKLVPGILYDDNQLYIYKSLKGDIIHCIKAKWSDAGTKQLVKNSFPLSPWEQAIIQACKLHEVHPLRCLGVGGTARVIEVYKGAERYALKVVLFEPIYEISPPSAHLLETRIYEEHAAIRTYLNKPHCPTLLSDLKIGDSFPYHGSFYIAPVGTRVSAQTVMETAVNFQLVVKQVLLLYQQGIYHGDARLPNLLLLPPSAVSSSATLPSAVSASSRLFPGTLPSAESLSTENLSTESSSTVLLPGTLSLAEAPSAESLPTESSSTESSSSVVELPDFAALSLSQSPVPAASAPSASSSLSSASIASFSLSSASSTRPVSPVPHAHMNSLVDGGASAQHDVSLAELSPVQLTLQSSFFWVDFLAICPALQNHFLFREDMKMFVQSLVYELVTHETVNLTKPIMQLINAFDPSTRMFDKFADVLYRELKELLERHPPLSYKVVD